MTQNVTDEDGVVHHFPDNATPEQIVAALHGEQPGFGSRVLDWARNLVSQPTPGTEPGGPFAPEAVAERQAGVVQGLKDVPRTFAPSLFKESTEEFNKQYPEGSSGQSNRLVGQFLGTAGPVGLTMRAAKVLPLIGDFVTGAGGGNILTRSASRATAGALAGGEAAGLTSSSSSEPTYEQVLHGAETGAAIAPAAGLAGDVLSGAGTMLSNAWNRYGAPNINRLAYRALGEATGGQPLSLDTRELVPGSKPTLAEAAGSPSISNMQRKLAQEPENQNLLYQRQQAQREARGTAFEGTSGDKADLEAARESRRSISPDALFQPGQSADTAPVVQKIDDILAGAGGKRPAVQTTLNSVRKLLVKGQTEVEDLGPPPKDVAAFGKWQEAKAAQGEPELQYETDPETLYKSVRKHIGDLLDNKDLTNAAGRQSARELMQVRDTLDDAIDSAAPGFKDQFLKAYSEASKPVNAMEWLQGLNLTDKSGNITLQKVQSALRAHAKQAGASGVGAAKDVTEQQLETLRNIRDDLLREQNINLGKGQSVPAGPPSVVESLTSGYGPEMLGAGLGGSIGALAGSPEAGAAVGAGVGRVLHGLSQNRAQQVNNQLMKMVLNPETINLRRAKVFAQPSVRPDYGIANRLLPIGGALESR